MKYLIYKLFSGVGFFNQLFSLETAIYLANISNRKLILLIKHPLCQCGHASWVYGNFLDFFDPSYKKYLPHDLEVYYKIVPNRINNIINSDNCETIELNNRFSNTVFIDSQYKNDVVIDKFCNGRNKVVIDFDKFDKEYIYIDKSNASRCFYNFYTTKSRYILMSEICNSLRNLNYNITKDYKYDNFDIAIHLRLGDQKRTTNDIDKHSISYANSLMNIIDQLDNNDNQKKIVIMCDREDGEILTLLKNKYNIKFSNKLINPTGNLIKDFLLQKYICENSKYFIGTAGSTVSNYINYNFYLKNKPYNLYSKRILDFKDGDNFSWNKNNVTGNALSWSLFWEDNIYRVNMLTANYQIINYNSSYLSIVREINISPKKNKKVISFCLYDLNNERNKKRHFDKGVYVNYYYMKKHNYKDWIMRVYILHNAPSYIIDNIRAFGDIEIVLVDTNICLRALRYLPNDDPNVSVWLSRDLDSIVNTREECAVNDWLNKRNDKELMIMSDYHQHTWTIAGGMFGKINNNNNNISDFLVKYTNTNLTNINKFSNDCVIAEQYFYKENNYIQYYRAGKKLDNSIPFPDLSAIHCGFVGNISPIVKYYTDLQLEKVYPFLSNNSSINENDKFLYNPWKHCFKNSEPACSVIWKDDDLIMTVDPNKESGIGTWKTLNGDGKKLIELNTHIQILWENKKYLDAYMPDKNTISVKHGETWYNFNKTTPYKMKTETTKINRTIYICWTGDNIMGPNRKRCYDSLKKKCDVKVTLVTIDNLTDFIVPGHPIHPAYKYLSFVHRTDYLRCYLMYHYGGGYSDIKDSTGNWNIHFDRLENSDKEICGYPELRGQAAQSAYKLQKKMGNTQPADQVLIGCCNFICKPKGQITSLWYEKLNRILDSKLEQLKLHPADNTMIFRGGGWPTFGKNYPIKWNEIMGNIFHEVCYLHNDRLLRTLPKFVKGKYKDIELEKVNNLEKVDKNSNINFIHIPKNAGSSIKQYIQKISFINYIDHKFPDSNIDNQFIIIRDPIKRFISAVYYALEYYSGYSHIKNLINNDINTPEKWIQIWSNKQHIHHKILMNELTNISHKVCDKSTELKWTYAHQYNWISKPKYVLLMENLNDELQYLSRYLNINISISHLNNTKNKNIYDLSETSVNFLKEYYKKDYVIYDYFKKQDIRDRINICSNFDINQLVSCQKKEINIQNIVIYSNCQGKGISYFLKKVIPESKITIIENYDIIKNKKSIDTSILEKADLFIYQPISENHNIYSTSINVKNNIMNYLKSDCIKISFPYIYNDSLWIIIPPAIIDNYIGNYNEYNKYINTLPIEKLKSEGKTLDEIIELYGNNKINFNYKERYDNSMKILREKEELCDVIVSDYIEENIRREKLFFTQNHPTTSIFIHCVNQIMDLLKIDHKFKKENYKQNEINLPGSWIHTQYDINYWNFNYDVKLEQHLAEHHYIQHIKNIYNSIQNIYHLPFSIPSDVIKPLDITLKKKEFATIIPGKNSTYIYNPKNKANCIKYNNDYEISKYAFTYKKGGWDCLRHYEILANNCIPLFLDIDKCPEHTMYNFPKDLCSKILKDFNNKNISDTKYTYYLNELHKHTTERLTCKYTAEYVIKVLNNHKEISKPKILLLTNNNLNYSMATLSIGLRKLLDNNFVDYPKYTHIYNTSINYNISILEDNNIDRNDIHNKISNKFYDFIIMGSLGPDDMNIDYFFNTYKGLGNYNKNELIFIFGGDRPFNMSVKSDTLNYIKKLHNRGICFVRELNYTNNEFSDLSWVEYANKMRRDWNKKIKLIDNINK